MHYILYENYMFTTIPNFLSEKDKEGTACPDAIETKAEFEKEKGWIETIYLEKRGLREYRGELKENKDESRERKFRLSDLVNWKWEVRHD